MRIIISGVCGHMGQVVLGLVNEGFKDSIFHAGVDCVSDGQPNLYKNFDDVPDGGDCIVDFSHHANTNALTQYAVSRKIPLVIATTGQTDDEKDKIIKASETVPVFFAANYSMGVALLINLARKAASVMQDAEIEIVETHHDRKLDSPSGTALAVAEAVKSVRPGSRIVCGRSGHEVRNKTDIGISSVRFGNIVGIHDVIVGGKNESLTLRHEAYSRAVFAEGALTAAEFLIGKYPGLYTMDSMVKL